MSVASVHWIKRDDLSILLKLVWMEQESSPYLTLSMLFPLTLSLSLLSPPPCSHLFPFTFSFFQDRMEEFRWQLSRHQSPSTAWSLPIPPPFCSPFSYIFSSSIFFPFSSSSYWSLSPWLRPYRTGNDRRFGREWKIDDEREISGEAVWEFVEGLFSLFQFFVLHLSSLSSSPPPR